MWPASCSKGWTQETSACSGGHIPLDGGKKESVLDAEHPERFQVYHRWKCGPTLATMAREITCMHCAKIRQKSSRSPLLIAPESLMRFFAGKIRFVRPYSFCCRMTQT